MQIIRGTTPLITANVRSNIDLSAVSEVWAYIYQQGRVIIDKKLSNNQVKINADTKTITVQLNQEDTLALRANSGAIFQMRLIMGSTSTALATNGFNVMVREVYKDGIIGVPNQNNGGSTNE
jgi:hypothetical protein